jgi:hypothetical protein
MSSKIENMDQLKAEIQRLEARSAELKSTLKNDMEEIKEELKPANLLIDAISDISKIKFSRETFSKNGFAEGIRSIIEQVIQKAGKTVEDRAHGIVDKVFDRLNGFVETIFNHQKKRRPEENYFDGE